MTNDATLTRDELNNALQPLSTSITELRQYVKDEIDALNDKIDSLGESQKQQASDVGTTIEGERALTDQQFEDERALTEKRFQEERRKTNADLALIKKEVKLDLQRHADAEEKRFKDFETTQNLKLDGMSHRITGMNDMVREVNALMKDSDRQRDDRTTAQSRRLDALGKKFDTTDVIVRDVENRSGVMAQQLTQALKGIDTIQTTIATMTTYQSSISQQLKDNRDWISHEVERQKKIRARQAQRRQVIQKGMVMIFQTKVGQIIVALLLLLLSTIGITEIGGVDLFSFFNQYFGGG